MMDDLEQMIKQRLLEDLIDKMSDQSGDRLKPKGMSVEVAAPDKDKLAEGLEKAKGLVGSAPEASASPGEDDDEQRMLQLLAEDDEDDK